MIDLIRDDCRRVLTTLPAQRFRACVTSPPYWKQRQYLPDEHPEKCHEIGQEPTPESYVETLVEVFRLVRDAITDDGTLWVNIGSGYARRSPSGSLVGSTLGGSQSAQIAYRGGMPGKTAKVGATSRGLQGRGTGVPPGFKDKDLIPLPWMLGLALQRDGWWLRMDNIWAPASAMPESVTDRPTHAHEYVLMLSKAPRYFYNVDAVRQPHRTQPSRQKNTHHAQDMGGAAYQRSGQKPQTKSGTHYHPEGRNLRSVWDDINTVPGDGEHVAPMPPSLARRCILAGSEFGDHVLDPFAGSGTVGLVAEEEGRHATLIDLDDRAVNLARSRTTQMGLVPTGTT